MQSDQFDKLMRSFEWFHSLKVPLDNYIVLRIDGRSLTKFTEAANFEKPFDIGFSGMMRGTTDALITELDAVYGFTESDEISILLRKDFNLFDREVEKLVSVSAALASSKFTILWEEEHQYPLPGTIQPIAFDARIWFAGSQERVIDYFRWRAADAVRCGLNSWAYWTLRKEGMSRSAATSQLFGIGPDAKNEILFKHGINFNDLPAWQKRGIAFYWEDYEKRGLNPKTGEEKTAIRRRLITDINLPVGDKYSAFVANIIRTDEEKNAKSKI